MRASTGRLRRTADCPRSLSPKPLEPVRELRAAFSLVRKLSDEQPEGLRVSGDSQRTGIHWIETHVADQSGGQFFPAPVSGIGLLISYFTNRSPPEKPQDLIEHNCINLRLPTYGGLYAWEFEKGNRELRVRVDGQLVFNGTTQILNAALAGLGLAYVPEDLAQPHLAKGRLKRVLEEWCQPYSGYDLYYPSRRQTSPAFALLVDALRYRS